MQLDRGMRVCLTAIPIAIETECRASAKRQFFLLRLEKHYSLISYISPSPLDSRKSAGAICFIVYLNFNYLVKNFYLYYPDIVDLDIYF